MDALTDCGITHSPTEYHQFCDECNWNSLQRREFAAMEVAEEHAQAHGGRLSVYQCEGGRQY